MFATMNQLAPTSFRASNTDGVENWLSCLVQDSALKSLEHPLIKMQHGQSTRKTIIPLLYTFADTIACVEKAVEICGLPRLFSLSAELTALSRDGADPECTPLTSTAWLTCSDQTIGAHWLFTRGPLASQKIYSIVGFRPNIPLNFFEHRLLPDAESLLSSFMEMRTQRKGSLEKMHQGACTTLSIFDKVMKHYALEIGLDLKAHPKPKPVRHHTFCDLNGDEHKDGAFWIKRSSSGRVLYE